MSARIPIRLALLCLCLTMFAGCQLGQAVSRALPGEPGLPPQYEADLSAGNQ